MRLLIVSWRRKNCDLPSDDVFLGRAVGDPKNWHRLKAVVLPYFTLGEDGLYRQKRLLDERDYCARRAANASAAGRASALKRLHRGSTVVQQTPNEFPTPTPTPDPVPGKEVSNKILFNGNGNGKKDGFEKGSVTIKDPIQRVAIFQKKLAAYLGDGGINVITASMNLDDPNHVSALEFCQMKAREMGAKGLPHNWPASHLGNILEAREACRQVADQMRKKHEAATSIPLRRVTN
jgi:hypothetical protein